MPPHGYESYSANSVNLDNKQVYLAQVPADFDPRQAEFKSETEICCQGSTYFVSTSASIAGCDILSQSKNGILSPSSTKLAGLLALTKKVSLPKVDYEEAIKEKPLVSSVHGLRMRNFPTGYGPKSYGIVQEPKIKVTPTLTTKGTRRKHPDKSAECGTPRKKHKKDKHGNKEEKKKKKSHKEETV